MALDGYLLHGVHGGVGLADLLFALITVLMLSGVVLLFLLRRRRDGPARHLRRATPSRTDEPV